IPATLRDSLVARLDRLGRAKETAQVASAIGREFTFELLRAVSPLGEAAVQEDLDKLVAAELVFRRRRVKSAAYSFKDALVRDAAYESMLKRSRVEVHARIAKALEEKFPEVVGERPELMAQHLAAAEQKKEAIGYAQKAAMGALMRSAYAEAIAQAMRANGWLDAIDDARERAGMELGLNGIVIPAMMSTRGWGDPHLKGTVDRSLGLIEVTGDGPHMVPTLWGLLLYHHVGGRDRQKARVVAEQFRDLAERSGDTSHRSAAQSILGQCSWMEGQYDSARDHFER